jgi:tetratricopeptide (TPR) repeat protein
MDPTSTAMEVFNQALAYQNAGMLEEATAGYLQALGLAPTLAEAYCNLGMIQERQGQLQEAAESYRHATELKPELVPAWFNLGKVLHEQQQLAESAGAYREGLRLDPFHAPAHTNLAVVLDQQGCAEEALRHYEAAVSITPRDVPALRNLAITLAKRGRTDEAMDCYDRLFEVSPHHTETHQSRALLRESRAARALLAEGPTPDRLRRVVDDAQSFADRNRDHFVVPDLLACKKGCAWCCSLQVTVGAPEVFRIADYLRENRSEDELRKLRVRLAEVATKTAGMDAQERALSGVPCALLSDNACSVYPVRPLVCRGCNSTNAAACEEVTRRPGGATPINPTQLAIYNGTWAGMDSALAEAGLPAETYHLCSALLIALDNPDAVDRWLAREPVLEPALWKSPPSDTGRLSLL